MRLFARARAYAPVSGPQSRFNFPRMPTNMSSLPGVHVRSYYGIVDEFKKGLEEDKELLEVKEQLKQVRS